MPAAGIRAAGITCRRHLRSGPRRQHPAACEADRRTAGVRLPHAGPGGRDDGGVPGKFLPSSSIWARVALTSPALVFAYPPRPYPPSGAPVSST